jgi:hypothetical protein
MVALIHNNVNSLLINYPVLCSEALHSPSPPTAEEESTPHRWPENPTKPLSTRTNTITNTTPKLTSAGPDLRSWHNAPRSTSSPPAWVHPVCITIYHPLPRSITNNLQVPSPDAQNTSNPLNPPSTSPPSALPLETVSPALVPAISSPPLSLGKNTSTPYGTSPLLLPTSNP